MATSFHPELTGDRRVHALFVDIVRAHLAEQAGAAAGNERGRRERACEFTHEHSSVAAHAADERQRGGLVSGHSKWATTKHKKAGIDAKRGKLFAKLIKNIEVAARTGGGDLAGQPDALRRRPEGEEELGPQRQHRPRGQARCRALEAGGVDYQGITYEGYAAGGVAVLIECLTDNKNRSAMEVRTAMTRNGGSMADPGSVVLPLLPQGRRRRAEDRRRRRGRRPHRRARRRRRGGPRPRGHLRGRLRARPTWSPSAPRCRTPASTTTRPRPASCPA